MNNIKQMAAVLILPLSLGSISIPTLACELDRGCHGPIAKELVLRNWARKHVVSPFPSALGMRILMSRTGWSYSRIQTWFIDYHTNLWMEDQAKATASQLRTMATSLYDDPEVEQ